ETLEVRRRVLRAGHPDTLRTIEDLAHVRLQQEDFAGARALLQESVAIREKAAPGAWRTAAARSELGEALAGLKRFEEAEQHLHMAFNKLVNPDDTIPAGSKSVVGEAAGRLVRLYEVWDRPMQAARWRQQLAAVSPPK